jgi:hypothetical protein
MTTKRTTELAVGDLIVDHGEPPMSERITAIEPPRSGVVYKVYVDRQIGADAPVPAFFYTGCDAVHEVAS